MSAANTTKIASTGRHARGIVEAVGPLGEDLGAAHEQRQLGDLARLHLERSEHEPALRAGDGLAAHEDEEQDAEGDGEQEGRGAAPAPVVDPGGDEEGGEPDDGPDQLAVEEVPRRSVVGERGDRRRGQDHHEPDDVEDGDRRAQHDVRGRARQLLAALEPGEHRPAHPGERIALRVEALELDPG